MGDESTAFPLRKNRLDTLNPSPIPTARVVMSPSVFVEESISETPVEIEEKEKEDSEGEISESVNATVHLSPTIASTPSVPLYENVSTSIPSSPITSPSSPSSSPSAQPTTLLSTSQPITLSPSPSPSAPPTPSSPSPLRKPKKPHPPPSLPQEPPFMTSRKMIRRGSKPSKSAKQPFRHREEPPRSYAFAPDYGTTSFDLVLFTSVEARGVVVDRTSHVAPRSLPGDEPAAHVQPLRAPLQLQGDSLQPLAQHRPLRAATERNRHQRVPDEPLRPPLRARLVSAGESPLPRALLRVPEQRHHSLPLHLLAAAAGEATHGRAVAATHRGGDGRVRARWRSRAASTTRATS